MSPEMNANPPSVTRRKKNREKKSSGDAFTNFDINMSSCNYFPLSGHPYQNPDLSHNYYSFLNCSNQSEPMSLPIYPMNCPRYAYPGNVFGSSRHSSLFNNNFNVHSDIVDYMSLPVANMDQNEEATKRRFSDPGLPNESDSSSNSFDERFARKLTTQLNSLIENNRKLSREVMELRIELNTLKQHQNVRHYDREYEPGMLVDIIREVREAARVREDALIAKVKHIIEDKYLSVNHLNLVTEKNRNNDRITKIEEQLKNLNASGMRAEEAANASSSVDEKIKAAQQVLELEREALELRRELQDTRAKKEEADLKILELSGMLRRSELSPSDASEDGKASVDSISAASSVTTAPRVILSGPVTDL
ncbi:uncharacterized protein LOC132708119 [Cylas formicarius]|uniref:uncharacterized protein LOC132708119 n=1 Tax=Cylas formicarius TaxID=197179 RepID=UPI0029584280|nr:uncharacterized protein LOC132708119 [Cylas formicarius]